LLLFAGERVALAQPSATSATSGSPGGAPAFDIAAATEAYLATMPADKRAQSDAYFEGGYWLQLWDFFYGLAVAGVMLGTGLSARLRDLARRIGRKKPLETALYWVLYLPIVTVLLFPLSVYSGYFREHQYGLATQSFGPWLGDQLKGLAVGLVLGALFLPILFGIFRKAPRTWWLWGAGAGVVFLMFVALVAPVYINPIFNQYTKLADAKVRDPILAMARANGIPATDVYEMDASRQTTRISANVSGFLGTERITLNDNLLKRSSLAEIQAVMAHEMGHYVLNHVYELVLEFGLVLMFGFAFVRWAMGRSLARWGGKWRLEGLGDVASLPLLTAVFSIFFLVMTPLTNTIIRVNEAEADLFGLNAARQPDGFAEVAIKLGEYRKLAPGPIEEFVFFDHPSGRSRILMAMRWKAEHLGELAAAAPAATGGGRN
jgi:STE24 endopeptidase